MYQHYLNEQQQSNQKFESLLQNNSRIHCKHIPDGSQGYVLDLISSSSNKDIIFIATDNIKVQQITNAFNCLGNSRALGFFEWDTLPYELISPSKSIVNQRIRTLLNIGAPTNKRKIIVTTPMAALQKVLCKDILSALIFYLRKGDSISRHDLISRLLKCGYTRESSVNDTGEFSVRGSIIDISLDGNVGYRLDFFGDTIESIREFDLSTQISSVTVDQIMVYPSHELILTEDTIDNFEKYLISTSGSQANDSEILYNLKKGIKPGGIEQWMQVFYNKTDTIFSYLNSNKSIIVLDNFLDREFENTALKINQLYEARLEETKEDKKIEKPLHPGDMFLSSNELKIFTNHTSIILGFNSDSGAVQAWDFHIKSVGKFYQLAKIQKTSAIEELKKFIINASHNHISIVISCISEGSRDRIHKLLYTYNIDAIKSNSIKFDMTPKSSSSNNVLLAIGEFENGFISEKHCIITEQDIFGKKVLNLRSARKTALESLMGASENFDAGELVIHKEYGLGIFRGLETVNLADTKHDCLKIEYANNDKLFVPVENIELISKYGNSQKDAILDKLNSTNWQTRKAKIKKRIKESAKYLLEIAAKRQLKTAPCIEPETELYEKFCDKFPHVETEDQERSISEVKEDLSKNTPMDRLICGDVGFGKTEVAMRASFIAIKSITALKKQQVALICPTTILCQQHFRVFQERFEGFGVKIAQLSRLVSQQSAQETIRGLASGNIDMVIGTHALFNDKIQYHNLSLLIIDEEQHFGVSQKEKLKKLKDNIHVLSMSATPIPRTLQMSIAGIKDLSLIATPPVNRLVTKTSVLRFDAIAIKEAIVKEHARGGQVFYVCPRIKDIPELELKLKRMLPDIKICVGHGQMSAKNIDQTLQDFHQGKFDVLLSTSIIESGLDIPKANTIIIHKADKFGLGQLYQLRGRVGRSNVKSYAYFTFSAHKELKPNALKRLEVLQSLDQLGSGFSISSNDMDIRGYGNLVGEEQSGNIKEVGVELYQSMLAASIAELKNNNEDVLEDSWVPQINLGTSSFIPESYISDFDVRLDIYRRAAALESENETISFAAEMVDRFGDLPAEVEYFISTIKLKQLCKKLNIKKVDVGIKGIRMKLSDNYKYDHDKLMKFIISYEDLIKIRPDNQLFISKHILEIHRRSLYLEKLLKQMLSVI